MPTLEPTRATRVRDADDGRLLAELTGHQGRVNSAKYSLDGRRILTASDDNTARVWSADDGRLLAELTGHQGRVNSARYSPNGRRILTASQDNTARVWDASPETRSPEQLSQVIRARSCVRFEPEDGNVIVPCTPPPAKSEDKNPIVSTPSTAS